MEHFHRYRVIIIVIVLLGIVTYIIGYFRDIYLDNIKKNPTKYWCGDEVIFDIRCANELIKICEDTSKVISLENYYKYLKSISFVGEFRIPKNEKVYILGYEMDGKIAKIASFARHGVNRVKYRLIASKKTGF